MIGPDFSSEAEALSRLLSSLPEKYRLLQLGFDTTSSSLKDKTKFRNFFRTIPPDNIQVKVIVQVNVIIHAKLKVIRMIQVKLTAQVTDT